MNAFFIVALVFVLETWFSSALPSDVLSLLSENDAPLLSRIKTYDLALLDYDAELKPTLLEASSHSSSLRASLVYRDEQYSLDLKLNTELFGPKYSAKREVWRDGTHFTAEDTIFRDLPVNCHYQGSAEVRSDAISGADTQSTHATNTYIAAMTSCGHALAGSPSSPAAATALSGALSGLLIAPATETTPRRVLAVVPAATLLSAASIQAQLRSPSVTSLRTRLAAQRSLSSVAGAGAVPLRALHVVYDLEDLEEAHGTCGNDVHDIVKQHPLARTQARTQARTHGAVAPLATTTKYIEMHIGNDYARYQAQGSNTETHAATLVNLVDALYSDDSFDYSVRVILTGQTTFTTSDPWTITLGCSGTCDSDETDATTLLEAWQSYGVGAGLSGDLKHLLSNRDFGGSTIGLAYVGTGCTDYGYGIDMSTSSSDAYIAATVAHEAGHNLDAEHDGVSNTCASATYIMGTTMLTPPASTFSSCSKLKINAHFAANTCYDNVPAGAVAVCGDGFVDVGEECDCGDTDCSLIDPCCDGATCQLAAGATCASDSDCCDPTTCQARVEGYTCRAAASVCDLEEQCDGTSTTCPSDLRMGSGRACTDTYGTGVCFEGTCSTLEKQCQEDTTSFSGGPYSACDADRQTSLNDGNDCQTLMCAASGSSSCSAFPSGSLYITVDDGVPCNTYDGSSAGMCYDNACVSSASVSALVDAYEYVTTSWSVCVSCDEIQTRSFTCVAKGTTDAVAVELCGEEPAVSQVCDNELLGCGDSDDDESGDDDDIIVFGLAVAQTYFIIASVFIGLFTAVGSYMLSMWLTRGAGTLVARKELQSHVQDEASNNKG